MPSLLIAILLIVPPLVWLLLQSHGLRKPGLPPGPFPLPIIGNLHMMGELPHRALAKLAQKYGPIMHLRLGLIPTIVVSSSQAAELFLKQHDHVFLERPAMQAATYLWHGGKGIGLTPYGDYWRKVRKMCTVQLLTAAKVNGFEWLRARETQVAVRSLKAAAESREVVDVEKRVASVVEEVMFKMVVGKDMGEDAQYDLITVIREVMALGGAINLADFIPFLAPFDFQGLTQRMKDVSKKLDQIFENIIEDHLNKGIFGHEQKDILSIMLAEMNEANDKALFGRDNVKAIMLDLFNAGIDTTTLTVTWAISLLLKNPRVMKLLQEELDTAIGRGRMVQESDLPKLSYLDMVVKETLRLYPPGPLLLPRESMEDIVINGYMIPKKSRIIINFWAIARDSKEWSENANEFVPERFIDKQIDSQGQDFKFIPFGAGRRGCPGMHLGTITSKIILAQLVHCFHWELPTGMRPDELDMTEKFGISIPRAKKLFAVPSYRLEVNGTHS